MKHDEKPTYNGWSNYETWAVNLWLTNEEGSYRYWTDRTREVIAECADEDADHSALSRLAEELKESTHEACAIEKASLASDLTLVPKLRACERIEFQEFLGNVPPCRGGDRRYCAILCV